MYSRPGPRLAQSDLREAGLVFTGFHQATADVELFPMACDQERGALLLSKLLRINGLLKEIISRSEAASMIDASIASYMKF